MGRRLCLMLSDSPLFLGITGLLSAVLILSVSVTKQWSSPIWITVVAVSVIIFLVSVVSNLNKGSLLRQNAFGYMVVGSGIVGTMGLHRFRTALFPSDADAGDAIDTPDLTVHDFLGSWEFITGVSLLGSALLLSVIMCIMC